MLLTSKTIVQIQSKLEAIKACCVILSEETLIASVRVMNHVHSVTFFTQIINSEKLACFESVGSRFPPKS